MGKKRFILGGQNGFYAFQTPKLLFFNFFCEGGPPIGAKKL